MEKNPAEKIKLGANHTESRAKPLPKNDIIKYYTQLQKMTCIKGAMLRLHVLSGGARLGQLIRLTKPNVGEDVFTLLDVKGSRKLAGAYSCPISESIAKDLQLLLDAAPAGIHLFSCDGGATELTYSTISDWARQAAKDAGIEAFTPKRIRSGCSTLLTSHGIAEATVAKIQSNDSATIQSKHYNGYAYDAEKADALAVLEAVLNGATVKKKTALSSLKHLRLIESKTA